MMTKKTKKHPAVAATEPPEGWIHMELAIPPKAFEVFVRASIRARCTPEDIVNHILRLGYEGHQLYEQEEHVHAATTKH